MNRFFITRAQYDKMIVAYGKMPATYHAASAHLWEVGGVELRFDTYEKRFSFASDLLAAIR
jgi:hypothetical protein